MSSDLDALKSDAAIPSAASGRLAHLGVLRFAGPDAINFLQGQVSNDTQPLAQGAALLAAYSTAQGRVLAVLRLLPHSSGVMAILPRELVLSTLERLRKFVLRAKVQIEDASERFSVIGTHDAAALQESAGIGPPAFGKSYLEHAGVGIARAADAGSDRYWVIRPTSGGARDDAAASDPAARARVERDWRLADIRAGLPQVYAATSEQFVAQMLNLDLLDGISFSKGCYTGQEIIARTQHLGRIKRRMVRLRLPAGNWSIGQPLRLADGRSGRLAELASPGAHFEALAVLTLDPGAGADSGDAPPDLAQAVELPLPYTLKDR